jgi:hypothetical protein
MSGGARKNKFEHRRCKALIPLKFLLSVAGGSDCTHLLKKYLTSRALWPMLYFPRSSQLRAMKSRHLGLRAINRKDTHDKTKDKSNSGIAFCHSVPVSLPSFRHAKIYEIITQYSFTYDFVRI